jgi:hypothetical protein
MTDSSKLVSIDKEEMFRSLDRLVELRKQWDAAYNVDKDASILIGKEISEIQDRLIQVWGPWLDLLAKAGTLQIDSYSYEEVDEACVREVRDWGEGGWGSCFRVVIESDESFEKVTRQRDRIDAGCEPGEEDEVYLSSENQVVAPIAKQESKAAKKKSLALEMHRSFHRIEGLLSVVKDLRAKDEYVSSRQEIVDVLDRLKSEVAWLVQDQLDGGPAIRIGNSSKRGRYSHRELISDFCHRATEWTDKIKSCCEPARYAGSLQVIQRTFSLLMRDFYWMHDKIV